MYIFNILFFISLGWILVSSEQQLNTNTSSIYIFNYHSTVDNRTNLTNQNDNSKSNNNLNLSIGLTTQSTDKPTDKSIDKQSQPIYQPILNLTSSPSIERMEAESFKPDFIAELPKEERTQKLTITKDSKRDLPTSESAVILINSVNNSRMLSGQKISQLVRKHASNQTESSNDRPSESNRTDGDMLRFEDELDVQPHSFSTITRLNVNSTKSNALTSTTTESSTTTTDDAADESIGKKLKKKHLQMLELKKKFRNNQDKFKAIKIRAPRLRISNSSNSDDKQIRRHKIGYASLVRTRNVNLTDFHADDDLFIKKRIHNRDQLDSSGSENRQIRFIMIHSYKKKPNAERSSSERFTKRIILNNSGQDNGHQLISAGQTTHPIFVKLHKNRRLINNKAIGGSIGNLPNGPSTGNPVVVNNEETIQRGLVQSSIGQLNSNDQQSNSNMFSATYQSSSNRYIPKLLLPRFIRPKMYSLNGYIPKPNVQKFTSTTMSSLNVNPFNGLTQFQRNKSNRRPNDKQSDKVSADEGKRSRKFGSKSANDLDELDTSSSATRKRQILFMKRKGLIEEEEVNSVKPKVAAPEKKKNPNRKGLKATDFIFPKANYPKELLESLNIRPEPPKFEYPTIKKDSSSKDAKSNKSSYPTFAEIPKTSFTCPEQMNYAVFADIETRCQAWHMCIKGSKHSFLCANGTVFNEKVGVCDHHYNVDCSPSNVNSVKLTKLY